MNPHLFVLVFVVTDEPSEYTFAETHYSVLHLTAMAVFNTFFCNYETVQTKEVCHPRFL